MLTSFKHCILTIFLVTVFLYSFFVIPRKIFVALVRALFLSGGGNFKSSSDCYLALLDKKGASTGYFSEIELSTFWIQAVFWANFIAVSFIFQLFLCKKGSFLVYWGNLKTNCFRLDEFFILLF